MTNKNNPSVYRSFARLSHLRTYLKFRKLAESSVYSRPNEGSFRRVDNGFVLTVRNRFMVSKNI